MFEPSQVRPDALVIMLPYKIEKDMHHYQKLPPHHLLFPTLFSLREVIGDPEILSESLDGIYGNHGVEQLFGFLFGRSWPRTFLQLKHAVSRERVCGSERQRRWQKW